MIVLDVDHTLLHTWFSEPDFDRLPAYDTHRTSEQRRAYREQLLQHFPACGIWENNLVCPRPFLDEFTAFLRASGKEYGFYSTGELGYLQEILPQVAPELLQGASFVWGRERCTGRIEYRKDIEALGDEFGYRVDEIVMLDDMQVVEPERCRVPIAPFRVSPSIEVALADNELQRIQALLA